MTKEELVNRLLSIDKQISTRSWITAGGDLGELIDELRKEINREPSLPADNLDEAAQKVEDYYDVGDEHGYLYCHRGDIKDAFKSGAEWMAKQGYTQEEIVEDKSLGFGYGTLYGITPIINLPDSFKPGDKVIVQVRKKC